MKLENDENALYDHEVLEILLFNACPRVNTNPIAHALMERFCSMSEILNASTEELKTVKGVGDAVADYLRTVGLCYKRMGGIEGVAMLKTLGDCKKFVSMRLRGKTEEYLELYFTEKSGRVKRIYKYTSSDRNKVSVNTDEIVGLIAKKPYAILVAHNHLNGSAEPSVNDDAFTKKLQLICSMNNVVLLDHIIYADERLYSYNDSGKLDAFRKTFSLTNAIKWIENSD